MIVLRAHPAAGGNMSARADTLALLSVEEEEEEGPVTFRSFARSTYYCTAERCFESDSEYLPT